VELELSVEPLRDTRRELNPGLPVVLHVLSYAGTSV
jgi:hypothetical protein